MIWQVYMDDQVIDDIAISMADVMLDISVCVAQSRKLSNELALMKLHKDEQGEKRSKLKDKLGEKEVENKLISEEIKRDTK